MVSGIIFILQSNTIPFTRIKIVLTVPIFSSFLTEIYERLKHFYYFQK